MTFSNLPVLRSADLVALGYGYDEATRRRRREGLVRIRPGSFAGMVEWQALPRWDQHRVLIQESMPHLRLDAVVSGLSAAVAWGIPFLEAVPTTVEVTCPRGTGGHRSAHFTYRGASVMPDSAELAGIAVTSAARTAIDVARFWSFSSGLMAMDDVLRRQQASAEEIQAELDGLRHQPGVPRARLAFRLANPLAESAGESLSRARLLHLGAPMPELQFEIRDRGHLLGRVDMWWPQFGAVGEFDGMGKYGVGTAPLDVHTREAVVSEKLREDAIRPLVDHFLRWTWLDLVRVDPFEQKLRRAGILTGPPQRLRDFL